MTSRILPVSTGVATIALALGYALGGFWGWTALLFLLGGLWWLALWRGWDWMASGALVLFAAGAAAGVLVDLAAGLMLVGLLGSLVAWDLDHFGRRKRAAGEVVGEGELERRHLGRLAAVASLGLLFAAAALGIRIEFGFGVAFLLGALAILGSSWAIGYLRRVVD